MKVTKQSIIGDILDANVETAQFFFAIGMHCLGCPASRGETIEQACAVHGTDADALVAEIKAAIEARAEAKRNKNYAEADRIRNDLAARGITLIDTKEGTQFKIN